jgi:hypothetical protein
MSSIGNMNPRRFVEEFQKRAGLLIDGIAGPQTRMALWLIPEAHEQERLAEIESDRDRLQAIVKAAALETYTPDGSEMFVGKFHETLALLREAENERDDLAKRLSSLLCDLTGGLLSKPGYTVEAMASAVEDYFERTVAALAWDEGYEAADTKFPGAPPARNPYRDDS